MDKLFKDKNIAKKLSNAFGAILVLFVVSIVLGIVGVGLMSAKMTMFYNQPYKNSVRMMEIQKDMNEIGKELLWAVVTEDTEGTKQHLDKVVTLGEKITKSMEVVRETSTNPDKVAGVQEMFTTLGGLRQKIGDLAEAGKNAEAMEVYNKEYTPLIQKIQGALAQFSLKADENAQSMYNSSFIVGLFVVILTLLLGVAGFIEGRYLSKKITKSITDPIQELEAAAKKLGQGELDVAINYSGKDELGILSDNFRRACEYMQAVVGDTSYMLGKIAKGDFCARPADEERYVGEFRSILESMKNVVVSLNGTIKELDQGAYQVSMGSDQMAASAQSLAEGATEQAGAIEELTATVENVAEMSKSSAEAARQSAATTAQAARDAQSGQESMKELVTAMENISEVSREIQNIIGAIEDIASQTNLLSLNASIEAARAGEAGKGFAVVADQIGNLAADSAKSAVETRVLIEKSLQEVENGNEITRKTVAVLESIIKSMEDFVEAAEASSRASESQAEMLMEIQGGIEQIATVVQTNSAAAEETSATSEELSAQSITLKELVEQFQLFDKE